MNSACERTIGEPLALPALDLTDYTSALTHFPRLGSDEEAERFVETADLSEYDFSGFRPARFEFEPKAAQLNMRVPQALLDALNERARHRGIPYTRFIRELMEREVSCPDEPHR